VSDFHLPSWVPKYSVRKYFSRKIRETEKEIFILKKRGEWPEAAFKEWTLRKVWWGYKRYKKFK